MEVGSERFEMRHAESAELLSHLNSSETRMTSNTLIVISAIVMLVTLLVFLELHIRRSMAHSRGRDELGQRHAAMVSLFHEAERATFRRARTDFPYDMKTGR